MEKPAVSSVPSMVPGHTDQQLRMETAQPPWLLVMLVRLNGLMLMLALGPIVMPSQWMQGIHAWLGLGTFPDVPITFYLARSISAIYALHGLTFLLISFDLPRYHPLLRLLLIANAIFAVVILGIDCATRMPWWWTAAEGPPIFVYACTSLLLLNRWQRSLKIGFR